MNTNKKNGFLKVAGSMMAVTMLATCVVAGTMAKYVTNGKNLAANATVAKWNIEANSTKLAELDTNLNFTIFDTDGSSPYTEEEVVDGKIAPGTWGYAEVEIENKGEVDAKISATLTKETDLPAGMAVVALSEQPTAPTAVTGDSTTVTADKVEAETGATKIFVAFKWDFETDPTGTNDPLDTERGEAVDTNLKLGSLVINAEQVD